MIFSKPLYSKCCWLCLKRKLESWGTSEGPLPEFKTTWIYYLKAAFSSKRNKNSFERIQIVFMKYGLCNSTCCLGDPRQITSSISNPVSSLAKRHHQQHSLLGFLWGWKRKMHIKRLARYPKHCKPTRNARYQFFGINTVIFISSSNPHTHLCPWYTHNYGAVPHINTALCTS